MKKPRLTKQTFRDLRNSLWAFYQSILWFDRGIGSGCFGLFFPLFFMALLGIELDNRVFLDPLVYGEFARMVRVAILTIILHLLGAWVIGMVQALNRRIRLWYENLADGSVEVDEGTEKVKRETRLADGEIAEIIYDEEEVDGPRHQFS